MSSEVSFAKDYPLSAPITRRMRSDLLLVKPAGAEDWIDFADVFEVDGEPVRDRNDRPSSGCFSIRAKPQGQTAAILREAPRYNIGSVDRNVNIPVLPLLFLESKNQSRFKFRRTDDAPPNRITAEAPAPPGHFRLTTEVLGD